MKDFLLFLKGSEKSEFACSVLKDGSRMGPECHDNTCLTAASRKRDKCIYDSPVAQMDTVEKSGSDYSHFTRGKS